VGVIFSLQFDEVEVRVVSYDWIWIGNKFEGCSVVFID
jgi:hypothetical protein